MASVEGPRVTTRLSRRLWKTSKASSSWTWNALTTSLSRRSSHTWETDGGCRFLFLTTSSSYTIRLPRYSSVGACQRKIHAWWVPSKRGKSRSTTEVNRKLRTNWTVSVSLPSLGTWMWSYLCSSILTKSYFLGSRGRTSSKRTLVINPRTRTRVLLRISSTSWTLRTPLLRISKRKTSSMMLWILSLSKRNSSASIRRSF